MLFLRELAGFQLPFATSLGPSQSCEDQHRARRKVVLGDAATRYGEGQRPAVERVDADNCILQDVESSRDVGANSSLISPAQQKV